MSDVLTEFFYLTLPLFYVIGMIVSFTGIPLFILFWKRWLPKPARTFFWAARRRTPPILLVHDSGRGEFTTIIERRGEGIVKTQEGKYKILPRVMHRLPLGEKKPPAATPEAVSPEGAIQEQEQATNLASKIRSVLRIDILKEKFILDYSDWILKRCMLVGMNMPFFVGYTGKLCLLNPEALALYEMGEMMVKTEDQTLFNPNNAEGKDINDALQPLLLIDGRKIQQIIFNGFDQSQIAAIVADTEELMRVGKGMSGKMIGIIVLLIIIGVIGVGMFLLPQILPQVTP